MTTQNRQKSNAKKKQKTKKTKTVYANLKSRNSSTLKDIFPKKTSYFKASKNIWFYN